MLGFVRKSAICADFDRPALFLLVGWVAGTVAPMVQRTVAEQTVELVDAVMAWIISARRVCEKAAAIFCPHTPAPPFGMFGQIPAQTADTDAENRNTVL